MNKDGGRFRRQLKDKFIFWSRNWIQKAKPENNVGTSRNVHEKTDSSVRHGNSGAAIYAGLLMAPYVKAVCRTIGKIRWKFVEPVRSSLTCFNLFYAPLYETCLYYSNWKISGSLATKKSSGQNERSILFSIDKLDRPHPVTVKIRLNQKAVDATVVPYENGKIEKILCC